MIKRTVTIIVIVPVAIVLIALAVANRTFVPFTLDPFNPGNPALTISLPLFVYLFLALLLGVLIGGGATWMRQGRYRRQARRQTAEARAFREEAARAKAPVPAAQTRALSESAN
jgi:uncharacterized integral membrane protein